LYNENLEALDSKHIETIIAGKISKGLSYKLAFQMLSFLNELKEKEPEVFELMETDDNDYESLLIFKDNYQAAENQDTDQDTEQDTAEPEPEPKPKIKLAKAIPDEVETIDKTEDTEEIDMTAVAAKIIQEPTVSKPKAPKIKALRPALKLPKAEPDEDESESNLTGAEILLKRKTLRPQPKVMQLGNGTVLYRNYGKLDKKRYNAMNTKVGSPKILMIDITTCQAKIYPVVIYLSSDSQHIDILEFAAKAVHAIEQDEDGNYGCVKGQNYTISGYDNSARYIYMRLDRYKAAST